MYREKGFYVDKIKGRWYRIKGTYKGSVYWWRWGSEITRSIAPDLKGCPLDDLDPLDR